MSSLPLYQIGVFLHVASAVGLFAVLAVEWVSLRGLTKSTTYEQAREWAGLVDLLLPLGLPATLVVLASGIYLATTAGFWELSWVNLAVPTYILVVIAGAIVGPRRNRLRTALAEGMGSLPDELRAQVVDPIGRSHDASIRHGNQLRWRGRVRPPSRRPMRVASSRFARHHLATQSSMPRK